MRTYTTLDGTVYDFTDLDGERLRCLEAASEAYRHGMAWAEFNNTFVTGPANPLLRDTSGVLTRAIWNDQLFQAVYDLGDRLGVAQGMVAHHGPVFDPFADKELTVPEAAKRKGVSVPGLHKAIGRGTVLGRRAADGGWYVVSANSLDRWHPNPVRQAARRGKTAVAHPVPA